MERSKPLVLIVDDEAHILHVVALKLANAGFEVVTADDGDAGLATALEALPDLVITDFQMPTMDGITMCQRLLQDARTADTPVIMLTARGANLRAEEMQGTNILEMISKPFSPRELLGRVAYHLEHAPTQGPQRTNETNHSDGGMSSQAIA